MMMIPNFEHAHSAEKPRDTTLDDEKIWRPLHTTPTNRKTHDVRFSRQRHIERPLSRRRSVTSPKLSLRTSVTASHVTCLLRRS